MALVTRSTSASLDASTGMYAPQRTGNLYAGEALDVAAPCYIKASDGLVYMSNGTAANEAAKFDGFTARACAVGEPVTLFGIGARFRYGTSLTVGADYYIAATAGRLDTAPTTGGVNPIVRVLHGGTDIRVTQDVEDAGAGVSTADIAAKAVTPAKIALTDGQILVGDATGAAADVAVTGDVTISNTGVTTIGAKKVVETMIALADGKIFVGDAGADASAVTPTGDVTITNTGVTAIGAGKVTNAMVAPASLDGTVAKVSAAADVIGAIPVLHRIDIAAGALADTDVVLTHKTRVVDAWLVLRGAGVVNTTLQVKSTAAVITDAMAASGADLAIVRAASIDDAAHEIAAGGILRVTSATGASQPDATVYVLGVRVA